MFFQGKLLRMKKENSSQVNPSSRTEVGLHGGTFPTIISELHGVVQRTGLFGYFGISRELYVTPAHGEKGPCGEKFRQKNVSASCFCGLIVPLRWRVLINLNGDSLIVTDSRDINLVDFGLALTESGHRKVMATVVAINNTSRPKQFGKQNVGNNLPQPMRSHWVFCFTKFIRKCLIRSQTGFSSRIEVGW